MKSARGTPIVDLSSVVGKIAEQAVRALIKGYDCDKDQGDFCNPSIGAGFEVKAASTKMPFMLRLAQLQRHYRDANGKPFTNYVYCLFQYRRTRESRRKCRGRERRSLLASCRTLEEVRTRVLLNTQRIVLVDIEFLMALYEKYGTKKRLSSGERVQQVMVNHSFVAELATNGISALRKVGLDPREWMISEEDSVLGIEGDLLVKERHVSVLSIARKKLGRKLSTILVSPLSSVETEKAAVEDDNEPF